MKDKIYNPPVIAILEQAPGQFFAKSSLDDETTANIMMQLAINFYKQSAIKKHEARKVKQGAILNPHTGLTMPKGN